MKAAIVAGGFVKDGFTLNYIREHKFDMLYAVDRGMEFFYRTGLCPDVVVGDFDSVDPSVSAACREAWRTCGPEGKAVAWEVLDPVKDDTDTEHALQMAIAAGCQELHLLGATGSRLDHVLGNIQLLGLCLRLGVKGYLVDEHNRLQLIGGNMRLLQKEQFGKYVSLIPYTPQVTGLTLTGFRYPLTEYTMSCFYLEDAAPISGISNEIAAEEAWIELKSGILILVESRD